MNAPVAYSVRLTFHTGLDYFTGSTTSDRSLKEKTSVKDVIEACGVPHPEVDGILVNGAPVSFSHCLTASAEVEVFGVPAPPEIFRGGVTLQRHHTSRFVCDVHLGKLGRRLRLLGFDVAYDRAAGDSRLVQISVAEERALLTRDRRLLMHAAVQHGYCPRSDAADEQCIEVLRRFQLASKLAPFTRCLTCNGELAAVDKQEIIHTLEPLTRIHYEEFRRCNDCGKIYWSGSHAAKLQKYIARVRELSAADERTGPERI